MNRQSINLAPLKLTNCFIITGICMSSQRKIFSLIAQITIAMSPLLFGMENEEDFFVSAPTVMDYGGKKYVIAGSRPHLVLFKGTEEVGAKEFNIPSYVSISISISEFEKCKKLDPDLHKLYQSCNNHSVTATAKKHYIEIKNGYTKEQLESMSKKRLTRNLYYEMIFKQSNTEDLQTSIKSCENYPPEAVKEDNHK